MVITHRRVIVIIQALFLQSPDHLRKVNLTLLGEMDEHFDRDGPVVVAFFLKNYMQL
jgi:hypothetical protein